MRLSEDLAPASRAVLAEAMVADVLDALHASRRLDGVLVVTNESRVVTLADGLGATVIADPH